MPNLFYTDIFATKGIEYLLIISFFLIFIPFYSYLKEVEGPLFSLAHVRLPRGVFFDKTHTWAYLKSAGQVQVGIDDFLAALTGPVSLKLHKSSGENVERGDHLATLMSEGKSLKVYSPVTGTLKSINKRALHKFSKRTSKEFTENWLFDMAPKRWDVEKAMLILGEKAQEWMQQEQARLRDVLAFAERKYDLSLQPVLLQEGGEIQDQVLEALSPEIWEEFQSEFIDAAK
jgi:glycine cleavage system H protein